MNVIESELPGCLIFEPKVFGDDRGYFYESFNADKLRPLGLDLVWKQGNVSSSAQGVLRGLHYQWPKPQGKFVSVIEGEVWDVAVDIRRGSPTFGQWTGMHLSADNKRHFWIPEGFAHGFVVLSKSAIFSYLCTETYDAQADANIAWNDPDLNIAWPLDGRAPSLSGKDTIAPLLRDIPQERLPIYQP
ncbi:dTDP-4-dehydrorhamnose 3,5-epimerase [Lysobacter sp. HDW10]|jgi:dTDP-4-dehydrorhamnose 3,5-epimerase|uniref:dTDP-4-dehydrorhamnose 3,5-epimerase n=1 Tax=Lysobacter sp. HDW10 TaxID=2714936 RepID=UPI00140E289D|nr:dTDP-4-dehydrorhamnose 3,5-epimerase [Lysobacter sp. HDW10]QIK80412.1 dTDP-4-dehydrorhamnose 3,5-epimerase [Lysobacter sp. HDW10]